MKITKAYLKKLIKEEIAAEVVDADDVESNQDDDDEVEHHKMGDDRVKVGDFLQVRVGGGEHSVTKVTGDDPYKKTRTYTTPFKAKVKIVHIAELAED